MTPDARRRRRSAAHGSRTRRHPRANAPERTSSATRSTAKEPGSPNGRAPSPRKRDGSALGAQRVDLHRDGRGLELRTQAWRPARSSPSESTILRTSHVGRPARRARETVDAVPLGNVARHRETRTESSATRRNTALASPAAPRSTPRELDPLADRNLGRRLEIQQLIRTDAQRVAHLRIEGARIVEHAVEGIVQTAAHRRRAQGEPAREGGVPRLEPHGGADFGSELARIPVALPGKERSEKRRGARGDRWAALLKTTPGTALPALTGSPGLGVHLAFAVGLERRRNSKEPSAQPMRHPPGL